MRSVFSDAHRGAKILLLWGVFLALAVQYGLFESRRSAARPVGIFSAPIPEEGAPVALSFSYVRSPPGRPGALPEIHTEVGWLPVIDETGALALGETTSLIGRIRPDGVVVAEALRLHPDRGLKTRVSLVTLLAFLLLGLVRPALWRGPWVKVS